MKTRYVVPAVIVFCSMCACVGAAEAFTTSNDARPKFMHRYGYYECRCRLQQKAGWWSAF